LADKLDDGAQAEISRLRQELARVTLERGLLVKLVVRQAPPKNEHNPLRVRHPEYLCIPLGSAVKALIEMLGK
jgi:hypothetical protein